MVALAPCASAIARTIASPSPDPPWARDPPPLAKRSQRAAAPCGSFTGARTLTR